MTSTQLLEQLDGLVAFWDFAEDSGQARRARLGRATFPLDEVAGPVPVVDDAPVGGRAVRFDQGGYLVLPHAQTGELNISGPTACLSVFAVARFDPPTGKRGGTVAGMWYEGLDKGDHTGTRQYALLLDMNLYGGADRVTPHISAEGGGSRRAEGSLLPWCVDYAASQEPLPRDRLCSIAMTYDGDWITAYVDGIATPRAVDPDVALQRAIDARKEAGEPIPVSWIKNPYYLRYYAHLGELLDDAGSPVPPPAAPSAEGAS